jgi:hypothetical protein
MCRHKHLLLALPACGAAIALFAFLSNDPEPSYQGKPLKQWMNIYCWPDNPTAADLFPRKTFFKDRDARRNEAAEAVRQIGTNAIPTFLKWADKDYRVVWKHKLWEAIPKSLQNSHSLQWWLVTQDHYRVNRALSGFYLLGSNATPAVPELTRRMMTRNSDSGITAVMTLGNMGGPGLPALLSALTNTRTPNRVMVANSAIQAISVASNDISGFVVLAQCVQDVDPGVGSTAAEGLGLIMNQPSIAIPALVEGLKVSKGQVRARSADALGNYGAQARSAVPALLEYQNDADWFVRQCVSNALQKLVP